MVVNDHHHPCSVTILIAAAAEYPSLILLQGGSGRGLQEETKTDKRHVALSHALLRMAGGLDPVLDDVGPDDNEYLGRRPGHALWVRLT